MLVLGSAFRAAMPLPPRKPALKPSISAKRVNMMLSVTGSTTGSPLAIAARRRAPLLIDGDGAAGLAPPRCAAASAGDRIDAPRTPPAANPASLMNPRLLRLSSAITNPPRNSLERSRSFRRQSAYPKWNDTTDRLNITEPRTRRNGQHIKAGGR